MPSRLKSKTEEIGEKIRLLRESENLTQKELAIIVIKSESAVRMWELGKSEPDLDTVKKLAKYFKVSLDYLLGEKEYSVFDIPNINPIFNTKVPLIGSIACGTPILATENVEDYIDMDESIHADFCLRCKGDSMINARIFDGDIVYIHQQSDINSGEIAAVLIDNEATLKRVIKYPNRIELRAENPTFAPIEIEGEDLAQLKIIGKAVAFLSQVR